MTAVLILNYVDFSTWTYNICPRLASTRNIFTNFKWHESWLSNKNVL